jgi:hypothetical protein
MILLGVLAFTKNDKHDNPQITTADTEQYVCVGFNEADDSMALVSWGPDDPRPADVTDVLLIERQKFEGFFSEPNPRYQYESRSPRSGECE